MITHAFVRRSRRAFAGCALFLAAFAGAGCDKVPLLAPTGSKINLFATNSILPVGGFTDITATVLESSGTPVHNGTVVTFTTTLGTIEPREARTNNGQATARLIVGNQSGTAIVRAFSGGASSPTDAAAQLSILVGAAGAETISLVVSPANVPFGGGTVQAFATVRDASGNPLPGAPVSFSTTAGTLSANLVTTDGNGQARTSLTTNREADVTATVAGKTSNSVKVTSDARPGLITVGISAPATITEDQPASFTITVTRDADAPRVRNVRVDWGDGSSSDLGQAGASTTISHTYRTAGTRTVTATATDEFGATTSASTQVDVTGSGSVPVTVDYSCANGKNDCRVGEPITFTATATAPQGDQIVEYRWSWGDGTSTETTGNQATHVYLTAKTYNVTVTVTTRDGNSGFGQTQVKINEGPGTGTIAVSISFTCSGGSSACNPLENIPFTANGPAGTTITSSVWDWGDPTPNTPTGGDQTSHAYTLAGTYTVVVTVTTSDGSTGTGQTDITIVL